MSFQSSLLLSPNDEEEGATADGAINYLSSSLAVCLNRKDLELSGHNKMCDWGLRFNSYAVKGDRNKIKLMIIE